MHTLEDSDVTDPRRRRTLAILGSMAASGLMGCSSNGGSGTTNSGDTTEGSNGAGTTSGSTTATASTTVEPTRSWASGGTELITTDFPADAIFDESASCNVALTETTTEGPCYLGTGERSDIAESRTGLPMMLCIQLVDAGCTPLQGYLIEVWHCDTAGVYSADTASSDDASSFAGDFCSGGDSAAQSSLWFRGELTTDANGRVDFLSCLPGWYRGRTVHIHFRVRDPAGGQDSVVSQFCFDDDFLDAVFNSHEQYVGRGSQDTPLSGGKDTVFPAGDASEYMMNIAQNDDGSLLAWKRIMITAA